MGWKRTAARAVAGAAWRHVTAEPVAAAREDTTCLPANFRVDPDWRRVEGDRAARLDARTTIDVTRVGRWEAVDTRAVEEAWSRPGPFLGLVAWGAAVGGAWWVGRRRGSGPLRVLHRRDPWN